MKKRASRKSKKPLKREECTYCIEILDWEMPYHLSLSPRKDIFPGPYWEHISLKLNGKFLYPEKLADINIQIDILEKGSSLRLTLEKKRIRSVLA